MKLKLPPGQFDAYLFDLDGTIADSMPLHFEAWNLALGEYGGEFPKDLFYAWAGIPLPKTIEMLNGKFGLKMPVDAVLKRKEELYYAALPKIKPVLGVLEHILEQRGKMPLAVVSGSPRGSIEKTLDVLGLADAFQAVVGAEDYARGKPDPEPFLLAAQLLRVEPGKCLVFEDGELGIRGAESAGMSWVRVPISTE